MEEVKVVYALIKNIENQILMVHNHEGHWSLPGGKVEADETLIEATIRETFEETGYKIVIGNLLAVNESKFTKRNHHALFFTFEAQIVAGVEEIKLPLEISQIDWAAIETANLRMPYYSEGIEKLLENHAFYSNQGTI
ncbi:NUDIX hydrolase [Lysinibacillus sp. NPDC048646]|uniref:NUDIX hydrolase n=1 Tax=Lysinibacillus sp. NPDC048646 TaxID=3390574 RepID=UPI003D03BCA2